MLLREARDEHGVIHDPRRAASGGRVLPLRKGAPESLGEVFVVGLNDHRIDNRSRLGDRHTNAHETALSVLRRRRLVTPHQAWRRGIRIVRQRIGSTLCVLRRSIRRRMRRRSAGCQENYRHKKQRSITAVHLGSSVWIGGLRRPCSGFAGYSIITGG